MDLRKHLGQKFYSPAEDEARIQNLLKRSPEFVEAQLREAQKKRNGLLRKAPAASQPGEPWHDRLVFWDHEIRIYEEILRQMQRFGGVSKYYVLTPSSSVVDSSGADVRGSDHVRGTPQLAKGMKAMADLGEADLDPVAASGPRTRSKPGPKPDRDTAVRVTKIVADGARNQRWQDRLDEILEALDEAKIPTPKTWRTREAPLRNWSGAIVGPDRELAKKAIAHHLKNARQL